jgi:prolyl-tRNA editing enzyme YbaK/EbsC (Cys-tRNA(Pro) deacylase)
MPVFASSCLGRCDEIFFNAGSHRETIGMLWADFARLVQPKVADLCRQH